eukprot:8461948-Pyramimonas_sp.AAC.2
MHVSSWKSRGYRFVQRPSSMQGHEGFRAPHGPWIWLERMSCKSSAWAGFCGSGSSATMRSSSSSG